MRPDRHGGTGDDDRKTGCRSLHGEPVRQHFRVRIGPRRVVGGQQRIIRDVACGRRATEENGFRRAVQEPRNTALARRRDDHLGAVAVDSMKIAFSRASTCRAVRQDDRLHRRLPARDPRGSGSSTEAWTYSTPGKAHAGAWRSRTRTRRPRATSAETRCWPMKPVPPVTSFRVMSSGSARLEISRNQAKDLAEILFADDSWRITARSRLKPSAINNFAITNIGPSSK